MKSFLAAIALVFVANLSFAQSSEPEEFYQYIADNLMIPRKARMSAAYGRLLIKFKASPDGTISELEIPKKLGSGFDEEASSVLTSTPGNIVTSMITQTGATSFALLLRFDPKNESLALPMAKASSTSEYYALREILVTKFKPK